MRLNNPLAMWVAKINSPHYTGFILAKTILHIVLLPLVAISLLPVALIRAIDYLLDKLEGYDD